LGSTYTCSSYLSLCLLPLCFSSETVSWPVAGLWKSSVEGVEHIQRKNRNRPHRASREIRYVSPRCLLLHSTDRHVLGPIVRIAPNELSFSSPYAAREVLAAGKGFHKTNFYGVFPPAENPDIFTETNEHAHGVKKRYASNAYSMAAMQGLSEYIEDTQKLLTSKLDQKCKSLEQTCDLGAWLVSPPNLDRVLIHQRCFVDECRTALFRIRRGG